MSIYKLILYPASALDAAPETASLLMSLKNCGLISGEILNNNYLPGPRFIEYLSFLGCSPNICLSPAEGKNYCHLMIIPWQADIHCLGYTNTVIPRCPHCKNKLTHWQQITNWQLGATPCHCSHCNTTTAMQHLNWKQECSYGCMAVEIINIHPFEAVPSEDLLTVLQNETNVAWNYCYATAN